MQPTRLLTNYGQRQRFPAVFLTSELLDRCKSMCCRLPQGFIMIKNALGQMVRTAFPPTICLLLSHYISLNGAGH